MPAVTAVILAPFVARQADGADFHGFQDRGHPQPLHCSVFRQLVALGYITGALLIDSW